MQSDVRFTQAQKWDLLRMSGAAVVSTVFFAIPMFIARPELIPAVARSEARPTDTRPAADVSVLVSEAVATVTTPASEGLPASVALRVPSRRRDTLQSRDQRQLATSGRPLARRLGRLLAGSGRYAVRPFPSLE